MRPPDSRRRYAVLLPEDEEDAAAVIFRMESDDRMVPIEDDDELARVMAALGETVALYQYVLQPAGPVAEVTSHVADARFHGRNAAKWWEHEQAYARYDFTYTKAVLEAWTRKIQKLNQLAETVFVFANNHWQGQAVTTAKQLFSHLPRP